MTIVLEFFRTYWREILYVICTLLAVICSFHKKGKTFGDAVAEVYRKLPSLILLAEKDVGAKQGSVKKHLVLTLALQLYKKLTGVELTESSEIAKIFSNAIEDILDTPQKKGD